MMKKNKAEPQTEWDLGWAGWSLGAESYLPWRKLEKYSNLASNGYCKYANEELNRLCVLAGTDEYRLNEKKLADLTNQMEQACYDDMTFIPVYQSQSFGMQSERIRPAMDHYVPGYGWGYMWGDLVQ
jgi:ABC-type transport system substrate-binding protein